MTLAAKALGDKVISEMASQGFAYVTHHEEDFLRMEAKLIKDVDTFTVGHIVVFEFQDEPERYYILEQELDTFRPVVRKIGEQAGYKEVEAFLEERRLEIANMWGACCGGKVNAGERWVYEPPKEETSA